MTQTVDTIEQLAVQLMLCQLDIVAAEDEMECMDNKLVGSGYLVEQSDVRRGEAMGKYALGLKSEKDGYAVHMDQNGCLSVYLLGNFVHNYMELESVGQQDSLP